MNKRLVALALVLLVMLPAGALAENAGGVAYYQYNDAFGSALFGADEEEVALPDDKPSFLLYVDAQSASNLALVGQMPPLFEILGDEYVNILIVWKDEIPAELIGSLGLPMANNVTLAGKSEIGGLVPAVLVVDKEVVKFVDIDMKRAVERLMRYYPEGYLVERADKYMAARISKPEDKTAVLYFSMTGCPDCAEADGVMAEVPEIDELFEFTRIYRFNETNPEKWTDFFALFASIYGITWYPSYLVFNGEVSTVIGQVPVDTLSDLMIAAIERD